MAAFRPGPRVVRDLIGGKPARGGDFLGDLVQFGGMVVVGKRELPGLVQGVKGRAFLDGELVERQMVCGMADGLLKLRCPCLRRLAGARLDQVERQARKDFARQPDRVQRFRNIVQPAEEAQIGIVQRLHAERHPVDAGGAVAAKAFRFDR